MNKKERHDLAVALSRLKTLKTNGELPRVDKSLPRKKNLAAAALGRLGGAKTAGKTIAALNKRLSPAERHERAVKAINVRWGKKRQEMTSSETLGL